ncbi:PAS domain S-box-containing protein [Acidovorax sp. 107]|uniref:PAS domain S-box protein n=1 Tax=Acidovorax sp. 107 TaxID=2135638 RepID=UPI000D349D8A|nr:PAS domain S-box protein [Acidovorax sp. 107]PUA98061.1 PAS domain S-box-containing protein [Acidovorax sp. 107]
MLDLFFLSDAQPYPLLWAQHNPWLVALSVAMAVLASVLALQMAGLARRADTRFMRQMARGSGAMALGGGIWSMHFIGMLAFAVCARGQFDVWTTVLSMVPSVGASWVALGLLMRREISRTALVAGGVCVGAGIGAMHYIGMAASQWAAVMRYDPRGFAASVLVAVLLAIVALWVRFGLERWVRWRARWLNAAAGTVMGLAIAGMHYTGMAALRFTDAPDELELLAAAGGTPLALAVAAVASGIGLLVIAINAGLRYRQMYLQMRQSESRLRAIADTAVDGMVMIDARGRVQSFNAAAERILGWRPDEVVGQSVSMLMPEPDRSRHDTYLQRYLQGQGSGVVGANSREVLALRPDGSTVPIRISVGRVPLDGDPVFVGFISDLTQRRAMEQELQASEQRLRSLMANIPGVTFRCRHDADWTMLFVSDAVTALTGWLPQDFLEGRITFTQLTLPEEVDRLWAEVSVAIQERRPYHVEFGLRDREGRLRWVSESGRPVVGDDGQVLWIDGVIMDMTVFRERNAEFESTVRAINRALAVVEFDMQGHVLDANANFCELMGYRLDEIVGRHHRMFCEPAYAQTEAYAQFWAQLRAGQLDGGEYERLGKDGRRIWIQATYNPIFDVQGRPFKVVKFATDLSQRLAMEQALRAAKDRAEQAAAARSTFLANMSHEIRTPMNAIIGFTEALLDTPMDAQQRRHLGTVQHAARSMLRLLNDILDTAKLEKGAVELEIADFSLQEVCDQILASLRIHAGKKGLALQCVTAERVPPYLQGDALRLQQVLLNLLGNALKFTERGHVLLRLDYHDGTLVMEVEDTGIGIAAQHLERIFDPFAQADASTTRQFGGTGLGTTISRQLVELMGGSISVRSTLGVGTTFTVCVPLPVGQATAAVATVSQAVQLPPLRMLVVDDVPANIELLQIHLDRGRHQITVARDGESAVAAYEAGRFDVVLMDLQMPGMDGLEATRRIRAFEQAQRRKPVPVIALSASVLEQDRRNARAAGMDGFASKPLEPARLFREIARVLHLQPDAPASVWSHLQTPARPADMPPAPQATAAAVDWERGTRLWGQRALLRDAVARLLADHAATPATLQALMAQPDMDAARALAHRLRGAAGNLALGPLQTLAQRIEEAAHSLDRTALQPLVAALPTALQAVQQALAHEAEAAAAPAPGVGQHAPLTADQCQQALAAAQALQQALAQSELAQPPLDVLVQLLPADVTERLQEAIDRFDFDQAVVQLQQLRTHWLDEPLENPA